MKDIKAVTILGANGTMGTNIAGLFASFGDASVYMISRDVNTSEEARLQAMKSVRSDAIASKLVAADYSMLESCVEQSDLVFESVAENASVKNEITARVGQCLHNDAIICTGTSGLSITMLAHALPEELRDRYVGMHFFNPPYTLNLCEVIPSQYTNRDLLEKVKCYLSQKLFRTVVEVKDSPAFLGNRIGFQFINEAMQCAERYQNCGGIDYIDAIMGPFTGRSMAPLVTSDFVGLDVHKAIVDNVFTNTLDYAHETFELPRFAQRLIDTNRLGRKTKCGLYKLESSDNGLKKMLVYDIASDSYREKKKYSFPFSEDMSAALRIGDYKGAFLTLINSRSPEAELCLALMLKYVVYSLYSAKTVGHNLRDADDAMATGFNWCPPLAIIDAMKQVVNFATLVHDRLDSRLLSDVRIISLLEDIESSNYDYRRFFKSIKR